MAKYVIVFLVSVFISSVSQIILKISTRDQHESVLKEYLNPKVVFAYAIFFCFKSFNNICLQVCSIVDGPVLESSSYIYVTVLGYFCLKEAIGKKKNSRNDLYTCGNYCI